MGKNKLAKFAEMDTLPNVFQFPITNWADGAPLAEMAGQWRDYFGNDNPLVLELGCGRGEYTVALARLYPDKNFIGVDIKGARMWHGAKQAYASKQTNVAFLRTNIEVIDRFFAPNEVSEIWLTFPDPQMKKATKRLTSSYFMKRYQRFVCPEGLIHLKTDSLFLFSYTQAVAEVNKYKVEFQADDLYGSRLDDEILGIQTYYEQNWLAQGKTIKYIKFQLSPRETFEEPEIEIEKDDYTSKIFNPRR